MPPTPQDPIRALRSEAEAIVADGSLDPATKGSKLRVIEEGLNEALGAVRTLRGDLQLRDEAAGSVSARAKLRARSNADIREQLVASGRAQPDQLDEMGYVSHQELDRLDEEGLMEAFIADHPELLTELVESVEGELSEAEVLHRLDELDDLSEAAPLLAVLLTKHGWLREGAASPGEAAVLLGPDPKRRVIVSYGDGAAVEDVRVENA